MVNLLLKDYRYSRETLKVTKTKRYSALTCLSYLILGGEITGKGTKSWEDGRYYEGEWKDGEMNGKGYWINKRTNEIYEGYFLDNKRHGFGTLQKGSESYKGYFKFHKYHGKGTLLRSHQFLISGLFEDGFATGRSTIDWMKTATMDCDWEKGSPSGFGYYSTKDRSYDFEGNFELSLPKLSEVASISWATLDRTDVEAENAGRDAANAVKKKDKKPAAGGGKKGKNDKPTIEPQFSMQRGEALGKVEIRFASSTHTDLIETAIQSLRSAYAAAKEAKPKLPPYDPSEEEKVKKQPPQLFAVPNERTRRISLRIRPFSVSVDTSHPPATDGSQASLTRTYSEPIDLWIRDLSLVESSNEKTRFSPKSIVIMAEDEKTLSWKDAFAALPSSFSPPPPVVFKRIIPSNVGNALIEDAAASDSVLTVSATSNGFPGFELNSYLLSGGQAASVRIDESRFDGSNQNIAFVIDFSLDSAKCAELRPSPIARSSKRSRSGGETFEIVVASFKKERLSLSNGRENCSLELVLIVPSANATASASQQGGDGSVSRQSAAGPSRPLTGAVADTARSGQGELTSGSPFDSLPIWKGCIWELRRVSSSGSVGSYASEPGSPDIRSIAESKADSSPFANGGSNGDIDGPVQSKAAEKRTICASWSAEDSFLPDYWHSVALILSSSSNTAEGESVAPQVEGNEEDPATPLPLPVPVEYKVDLLVDGAGRMRVERPTKNRRRKSPPRGVEANNSLSSSSGLFDPSIDSSASNGAQNPIEEFMNFFKSTGQEDADQDAETEPPSVEVSVGSSGFAGSLRSLVICGGYVFFEQNNI